MRENDLAVVRLTGWMVISSPLGAAKAQANRVKKDATLEKCMDAMSWELGAGAD